MPLQALMRWQRQRMSKYAFTPSPFFENGAAVVLELINALLDVSLRQVRLGLLGCAVILCRVPPPGQL